ncbi:hypothetical protein S40285_09073 [Stachybotrys chlorohalonatus IBT 40285]|uniref:Uncharacterized protein n=1 Tax=Stachybotrys chlorohalonatus (strain IBT 40285) TaxID=1283841 RepID=A0A084QG32_STAC4|nr:hypothetical protein S40285_09073 [Stachybotrys chlorohalonata IBT 40285]
MMAAATLVAAVQGLGNDRVVDSALVARQHAHGDSSDHDHSHEDGEAAGHDHGEEESSDDHGDHSGHGGSDASGAGSYGDFNFTATGITWPSCLQNCAHEFLDYLEPVNNPLCVSDAYYQNVTSCVVDDCSEYEQGAYAAVLEVECPDDDGFSAAAVRETLTEQGGSPQECAGVDNSTIQCQNSTSEEEEGGDGEGLGATMRVTGQTWFLGAALLVLPLGLML